MKTNRLWLYALILIWGSASPLQALGQNAGCPDKPATLILHRGKVFTGNDAQPQVEAVAIRGKLIVGVGNTADLLQRADANTKLVDLQGKLLIPGFNNAHVHLLPINSSGPYVHDPMESILGPGPTAAQMFDYLKAAAASTPEGNWLYGMAGQAIFDDPSVDRFALDKVVPNYPVLLIGSGGHWLYLNTAAIKAAGLSETESDPFGGFYRRVPGTNVNLMCNFSG